MKPIFLTLFCFAFILSAFCQDSTSKAPALLQSSRTNNQNYRPTLWNQIIGSSDLRITTSRTGDESLMGNFVSDAMLNRTEADFVFIRCGELYDDIFIGEITELDMFRLFPFPRTLVLLEINGDTLKQIIENTIGSGMSGLAIAGGKVEYDLARSVGNRLTYFQVGEYPLYPAKEYRVVTIDYHADGIAGFEMVTEIDSSHVFRTGLLIRDTVADYIRQNSPLDQKKVMLDGRWVKK